MTFFRKAFLSAAVAAGIAGAGTSARAVVINEVDYDNVGLDTAEFVELYNPGTTSVPIGGYVLGLINGSSDAFYAPITTIAAGTVLGPGAYYVIGNVTGANQPFAGATDQVQNGSPDAVGLYSSVGSGANTIIVGAASTTNSAALVDGIVYEGTEAVALYPGYTQSPLLDSNTANTSFGRAPDGTGTYSLLASPTPGAANAAVVPEPASLGLVVAAGGMLLLRRRTAR